MVRNNKGFTLIELLVVIAIIGILSSVVLASLNTARVKSRVAAAQSTMKGIQTAAAMCVGDSVAVTLPTATQNGGGGVLCSSSPTTYGLLPAGWAYNASDSTPPSSQVTGASFTLIATGDSKTVTCTESGCVTS